jgi:hypothetical protein
MTTTGHQATTGRYGDVRWQGDLHKWHSIDRAERKLTRYTIDGVPREVAHVRRDEVRGPWLAYFCGDEHEWNTKSAAQRHVEQQLGL